MRLSGPGSVAVILLLGSATRAVLAQTVASDDSGALQEVVVTAQKRSENLQRVPISVAAISGDQLGASGIVE